LASSLSDRAAKHFCAIAVEIANDAGLEPYEACGMGTRIPVIVRMRIECDRCGHAENDIYDVAIAPKSRTA
jgi:hypothetical protein